MTTHAVATTQKEARAETQRRNFVIPVGPDRAKASAPLDNVVYDA